MKSFKVVFMNGDYDLIEGSRVYSSEGRYVIDCPDHPSVFYSCPKEKVKCVLPVEIKE